MSQKTLLPEESTIVGVEDVLPPVEQLPVTIPQQLEPTCGIRDLRSGFMMMPREAMESALAEFKDRRDAFRQWLRYQLVLGIHYGYPPGTEPKYADEKKRDCQKEQAVYAKQWKRGKDGSGGEWVFVPLSQWTPKPSLYKAGADFCCDLLGARDVYHADMDSWAQLGSPKGTFVQTCVLYSRITNDTLGEGRGIRKTGQKGGDENNAIKMAKKCAKVDAVLNTWGLSDLFTQDIEDDIPPVDNPDQAPGAPVVPPRSKRTAADPKELSQLIAAYKACKHPGDHAPEAFSKWAGAILSRTFESVTRPDNWTSDEVKRCQLALEDGR